MNLRDGPQMLWQGMMRPGRRRGNGERISPVSKPVIYTVKQKTTQKYSGEVVADPPPLRKERCILCCKTLPPSRMAAHLNRARPADLLGESCLGSLKTYFIVLST